jgi:hypothetical protein
MTSSRSCFMSIMLENSGLFLKYVVSCAKKHSYHFCIHRFPFFEWLAVQIWIIRRNSIKQTKSNSYNKHFYNCAKIEHVGIHSVETNHKNFGWKKEKNKNILLLSVKDLTLGKAFFVECLPWDIRHRILCRVSDPWHSAKYILKFKKNLCWMLVIWHSAKYVYIALTSLLLFSLICQTHSPSPTHSPLPPPHVTAILPTSSPRAAAASPHVVHPPRLLPTRRRCLPTRQQPPRLCVPTIARPGPHPWPCGRPSSDSLDTGEPRPTSPEVIASFRFVIF